MKSILIIVLAILLSGCQFFKKGPEDRYRDKMENATDEELMSEIIGKPLTYEVLTFDYANLTKSEPSKDDYQVLNANNLYFAQTGGAVYLSKEEGDRQGLEALVISSGAALQVIFTNGSVYIEKFGRLNGSYEDGKYANADGSIKLRFGEIPRQLTFNPDAYRTPNADPLDGGRNNPVKECERIGIVHSYTITDGYQKRKVNVHYYLKSLTKPGYFHKDSN